MTFNQQISFNTSAPPDVRRAAARNGGRDLMI